MVVADSQCTVTLVGARVAPRTSIYLFSSDHLRRRMHTTWRAATVAMDAQSNRLDPVSCFQPFQFLLRPKDSMDIFESSGPESYSGMFG
jgi:hypothetical protein